MSSDLLTIGASGARAYQAAMGAIADNIANTDTPGYSRRTVELRESSSSTSTSLWHRSNTTFSGVEINRVVRAADPYLDAAARQTANALGRADERYRWMSDVQTALNDSTLGVGQRFASMFSAVERLAANPTDTTLRADVLFAFEQINTAFEGSYDDLVSIRGSIGTTANNEIVSINNALSQLADANEGLRRTPEGTASHVVLQDSRDMALQEITKRLNVTIDFGANGVANVSYGGETLVHNNVAGALSVAQDADGLLELTLVDVGTLPAATGGTLGGLTESAVVVRDRIDRLDALAVDYVQVVNDWHTQGFSSIGVAGLPMLSIGANAGELALEISDPALVAGYSADDVINGNLLAISAVRTNSSMEGVWDAIVAEHGSLVSAAQTEQIAAENRDQTAQQARGNVVGVNLDREAADLIRLQQAYQASARIIQVAKELTDTIFAIF
jgi:flagellar hook-associated protein 1 FlgK